MDMYEAKQNKIPASRTLDSFTRFKSQCKKFEYGNASSCIAQIKNNVIQGAFILKQNGVYKFIDDIVNNNLYIKTDEYKCKDDICSNDDSDDDYNLDLFNREQRYTYRVYKERILDTRKYAKFGNETKIKNAKAQGEANDESISAVAIYGMLNDTEQRKFDDCINKIRTYCLEEDLTKVIEGALNNVHMGPILPEDKDSQLPDNARSIFLNRLILMTDYIANVGEQTIGNKTIKEEYYIVPTGSDPHMDGHHALFLVDKMNPKNKKVYKPHSLEFENAFMGKNGFLSSLNHYIDDEKKRFALMDIDTNTHTEEFIERKGGNANDSINEETFNLYMYKLGMLEVAASIWGIIDLHAENIMFGANGPVAIDAECGGAFNMETGIEKSSPEGPVVTEDSDLLTPSSLYIGGKQQTDKGRSYEDGKRDMVIIIKSHVDEILTKSLDLFQNIDRFRILPISTSELAYYLDKYKNDGILNDDCKRNIKDTFVKYFQNSELFKDLVILELDECLICFEYALKRGTLPAFEFDLKNKCILIDNVRVGMINQGVSINGIMLQLVDNRIRQYIDNINGDRT